MVLFTSKAKKTVGLIALVWAMSATSAAALTPPTEMESVQKLCAAIDDAALGFGWKRLPKCNPQKFKVGGKSVKGRPLIYAEYGVPAPTNTTLVFSMVHGDEVTPLYVGFKLIDWLEKSAPRFKRSRVIVVPMVNPDGFFDLPRKRVNARGVDVNRNFPTQDWDTSAMDSWKKKMKSDPRRFPGDKPNSEPETEFQMALIEKFKPQKILSIHAPLNFMDYDGPDTVELSKFPSDYVEQCLRLQRKVKAVPGGFYPGSLGNYAGQERGIPTLTLELPSAAAHKADFYWQRFVRGVKTVIQFQVPGLTAELPQG